MVKTKEMLTKDGSFFVVLSLVVLQLGSIIFGLAELKFIGLVSSCVTIEQSPGLSRLHCFQVLCEKTFSFVFMLFWLLTILYFAISLKSVC